MVLKSAERKDLKKFVHEKIILTISLIIFAYLSKAKSPNYLTKEEKRNLIEILELDGGTILFEDEIYSKINFLPKALEEPISKIIGYYEKSYAIVDFSLIESKSYSYLAQVPYLRKLTITGGFEDHSESDTKFDLTQLGNVKELDTLSIAYPALNFQKINEMKGLESLYITGQLKEAVVNFKNLKNLKSLRLQKTGINNLNDCQNLVALKTLAIYDQPLEKLSSIKQIKSLRNIILSNVKGIDDFSPLSESKSLEQITIINSELKNVDFLGKKKSGAR